MSSHAIDVQWGESELSLYNSNELTFLLHHITPICVANTSVSAILQTPWNTAWGLLRSWHAVPVLFQNPAWQAQTDMAVSLWVSLAKYQFRLRGLSWPFCSDSPKWRSRHMVTWFGCHGHAFGTTENAFFSCIYNPQITVSSTSSFSASFNGNRVKNHPNLGLVLLYHLKTNPKPNLLPKVINITYKPTTNLYHSPVSWHCPLCLTHASTMFVQ